MTHIAGLILQIVSCLADNPRAIKINEVTYAEYKLLIVKCSSEDLGKIVGRKGRIAKAIRVLAYQIGARLGVKYRVEFKEAISQKTIEVS